METPTHLVVVQHGLMGNTSNVGYLADRIREALGPQGLVITPDCNLYALTMEGIDVGAKRIIQTIRQTLATYPTITEFSIIGYSLGGLYSRYVVGVMYEQGIFEKIRPINFATFATPHLGSRCANGGYLDDCWNWLVRKMTSLTGSQLLLEDKTIGGYPLLFAMSLKGSSFYQGLMAFANISLYANTQADRTVPYETSAICFTNPFNSRYSTSINPPNPQKYPHIISVQLGSNKSVSKSLHLLPPNPTITSSTSTIAFQSTETKPHGPLDHRHDIQVHIGGHLGQSMSHNSASQALDVEYADANDYQGMINVMVNNLNELSWRKVNCCLPQPHSHGHIIVRRPWLNFVGRDVVAYFVDHFQRSGEIEYAM